VLRRLNLQVKTAEVVVVIGPSGSGKSTLLRCIAGLEPIQRGEIYVLGKLVTHSWRLKGEVGFVFQQFNLFPHLTAVENVMLALRKVKRMKRGAAREVAMDTLKMVGLSDKATSLPSRLSGGQQQRVAIARSLAVNPKLMLFDEVTSALDRELVAEVLLTMRELAERGMTMIVVTHELRFAEDAAHRVLLMDQGEILEEGTPAQLLHQPQHPRTRQFLGAIAQDLPPETPRRNTMS
jgi:ABC-type polar amino acid transport system ATPase subunit